MQWTQMQQRYSTPAFSQTGPVAEGHGQQAFTAPSLRWLCSDEDKPSAKKKHKKEKKRAREASEEEELVKTEKKEKKKRKSEGGSQQ